MDEQKKLDSLAKLYARFIPRFAIAFFALVLIAYIYPRKDLAITTDPDYWGAFGDFLGGTLNPIFGFLTLLGLMLTIWLQLETLKVQREELKASREELAKSAEALQIQNKTMLAQNFEGTFFQMLRRQSELLGNIKFQPRTPNAQAAFGLDVINQLIHGIDRSYKRGTMDFVSVYLSWYADLEATIGPYFRNLYHLLKLVDQSPSLSESEKIKYAHLARAQLSSTEIALIFYNCLSEYGQGLKPLVIQYRLLKHIDRKQLCNSDLLHDADLYPPETYLARS